MDREQFKEYLRYVYENHVGMRLPHSHHKKRFHHMDEFEWHWADIIRISTAIRYINTANAQGMQVDRVFSQEHLDGLTQSVKNSVEFTSHLAEDTGFSDALDDHFDEIIDGIEPEDMPVEELEILRQLGSTNPRGELLGMLSVVKARQKRRRHHNELSVSQELKHISQRLDQLDAKFRPQVEGEKPAQKPRKWFKGLGEMMSGVGLTVADIGLAAGLLPLPVAGQTATVGALASAATGVGMIFKGIGELRGE